jgi:tetratricopeptide (TPR) repeat protein
LPNYLKARLAIVDQEWSEAHRLLESVRADLGPGTDWSSRVHFLLGLCHRQLDNPEEELKSFRRAVNDEPTWMMANVELGAALLNNHRLGEAIQALEPLHTAKDLPAGYWILYSRARLLAQMRVPAAERRWERVEELIGQAIKAEPKNTETLVLRAELATARADFAGVRDYRDALSLARFYQLAGDPASADKLLRQAVERAPHIPETWIAWTEHLQRTSRHNRGVQELERMKLELPAKRQPLTLARCYEALKMTEEAAKAYQDAQRDAPDDFVALALAADFARRTGRHDEARRLYERLVDSELAAPAEYTEVARRQLSSLKSRQK